MGHRCNSPISRPRPPRPHGRRCTDSHSQLGKYSRCQPVQSIAPRPNAKGHPGLAERLPRTSKSVSDCGWSGATIPSRPKPEHRLHIRWHAIPWPPRYDARAHRETPRPPRTSQRLSLRVRHCVSSGGVEHKTHQMKSNLGLCSWPPSAICPLPSARRLTRCRHRRRPIRPRTAAGARPDRFGTDAAHRTPKAREVRIKFPY